MSYRAGIGPGMRMLGINPSEAKHVCDGCGMVRAVVSPTSNNLMPPKWFFAGRPPPGWRGVRMHDGSKRWDLCPRCWKKPEAAAAEDGGS